MARKSPSEWPRAQSKYHPARQDGFSFETMAKARKRDAERSKALAAQPDLAVEYPKLIEALAKEKTHPRNMASARYLRTVRVAFNGQLLRLIVRRSARVKFSTLIPAGWLIPADKLAEVVPKALLEQLRAVLNRAGVGQASGWAVIVLDLEYIEHLDCWSFHTHGHSTGGKTKVIHDVRKRRKLKRCADHPDIAQGPVRLLKVKRRTRGRQVNYLVKTYFGKRVYIERGGKMVRTKRRVAVPARREAELLAWLSKWTLDDFVLTLGLHFGKTRLHLSKQRVQL